MSDTPETIVQYTKGPIPTPELITKLKAAAGSMCPMCGLRRPENLGGNWTHYHVNGWGTVVQTFCPTGPLWDVIGELEKQNGNEP